MIKLAGGRVIDPANNVNGERRDIYLRDGRIVEAPPNDADVIRTYDLADKIVMAGGIDIHSHIAGGKMNLARMLLPETHRATREQRATLERGGSGVATVSSFLTGYRYARMGYTAAFEPAVIPANARGMHLEMADIPIIDKGCYIVLGNDDFLLRMLAAGKDQSAINDYVAWMMNATCALGVKVVNPGGISAFKFNGRSLDVEEPGPYYGVTPRRILESLATAVHELGVPHPLHVHGNNLGVPGNVETTLHTIEAAEGRPMHLTHVQFHSYGAEGDRKFSSGAARIAEAVNRNKNITIDVGHIMFGSTVTASADTMAQYHNRHLAHPKKWVCMDIECEAGCGLVPFRYRDKNFVNALQWAIGLELFLLVDDPWRVFLTTDHPNGAPFVMYPRLIRLLMDRSFRNDLLDTIHPAAAAASVLGSIEREYTLYEIAILTRAAPARILGLADRGHLAPGAVADVAIYTDDPDKERMFETPDYVFKNGELVVEKGRMVDVPSGATQIVRPEFDRSIEKTLASYFDECHSMRAHNFAIRHDELFGDGQGSVVIHPCRERSDQ